MSEMVNELYSKKYYKFWVDKPTPVIFDVGALIGETVLYFKDQFPNAKIVAFEPSPRSFRLLKRNVIQNHLTNVHLVNAAVGKDKGKAGFFIDKNPNNPWGRGDSLKKNRFSNPTHSKTVEVAVVKLSSYIKERIDLLKLDIEGAETEVIQEIEPKLKHVDKLILEFHYSIHNPQNKFSIIVNTLMRKGFKLHFYLGKWRIPAFTTKIVQMVLELAGINEYWMRIYAQH